MDYFHPRNFDQFTILDNFKAERLRKVVSIAFSSDIPEDIKEENKDIENKDIYYIRSFYAVMFLTDKDNHIFLIKTNKTFIEVLFNNLYRALKESNNQIQLNLILHLYQFYFNIEPSKMIFNFLRFNLVHHLIFNLDKQGVVDFLISIIDPFDR